MTKKKSLIKFSTGQSGRNRATKLQKIVRISSGNRQETEVSRSYFGDASESKSTRWWCYYNFLPLLTFKSKYLRYWCEAKDFVHLWDKISYQPKVLDWENLHLILWTFIKYHEIVCPTFVYFQRLNESYRNSANIRQYLTVFLSDFNNIYLK